MDRGRDVGAGEGPEIGGRRPARHRRHIGADIDPGPHPHREEIARLVERERRIGHVVPPLMVADQPFRALAGPFHRPPDLARGPEDEDLLGIHAPAQPEAAADVVRDHPHPVLGEAEDVLREPAPQPVGIVAGGVERVPSGAVDVADEGARLHRVRRHPRDDEAAVDDAGGLREPGVHGVAVAQLVDEALVVRCLIPQRRHRPGVGERGIDVGFQGIEVDKDRLGGIPRLRQSVGDHHRDRFADMDRPVDRERGEWRADHRRSVAGLEDELGLDRAEAPTPRSRRQSARHGRPAWRAPHRRRCRGSPRGRGETGGYGRGRGPAGRCRRHTARRPREAADPPSAAPNCRCRTRPCPPFS